MRSFSLLFSTLLTAICAILISLPGTIQAQQRSNDAPRVSPNASVSQTIGTTVVTITYGRPAVNGREIYGGLVPFDAVWRAGANESTVVTVSDDVIIHSGSGEEDGQVLKAGSYSLFALPGEDSWSVMFNSDATQWGAYSYSEDDNVVSVKTAGEETSFMEQLTYYFDGVTSSQGTLWLHWADLRVPVVIGAATEDATEQE